MRWLQVSKSTLDFLHLESGDNCGWQGRYVPKCRRFTQTPTETEAVPSRPPCPAEPLMRKSGFAAQCGFLGSVVDIA